MKINHNSIIILIRVFIIFFTTLAFVILSVVTFANIKPGINTAFYMLTAMENIGEGQISWIHYIL